MNRTSHGTGKMMLSELTRILVGELAILARGNVTTDNHREGVARDYLRKELSAILRDIQAGKPGGAQRKYEAALKKADIIREQWSPADLHCQTEMVLDWDVQSRCFRERR